MAILVRLSLVFTFIFVSIYYAKVFYWKNIKKLIGSKFKSGTSFPLDALASFVIRLKQGKA